MVEFSLVHSITTEMCTGFLTLSAFSILLKFVADGYLRRFQGKAGSLDWLATKFSQYAEPASYLAMGAGVIMVLVSGMTGLLSWQFDRLAQSSLAHNKVLLTVASEVIFMGAFILRARYSSKLWTDRLTAWIYLVLAMIAFLLLVLQDSMAGQMAKGKSLLDYFFPWLKNMEAQAISFPVWGSILTIIGTVVRVPSRVTAINGPHCPE
jgi:uncharacterized membrane protein